VAEESTNGDVRADNVNDDFVLGRITWKAHQRSWFSTAQTDRCRRIRFDSKDGAEIAGWAAIASCRHTAIQLGADGVVGPPRDLTAETQGDVLPPGEVSHFGPQLRRRRATNAASCAKRLAADQASSSVGNSTS